MRTGILQPLPGLGDMIWHLPAIRAIAAHHMTQDPQNETVLLAKNSSNAAALFAIDTDVDEVITLSHKRGSWGLFTNILGTWRILRKARLDRLYILHHSPRYRVLAYLAGIRVIKAYPQSIATLPTNGWEKSLTFLGQISIPVASRVSHLYAQPQHNDSATRKFASHPKPWFVVAPGAMEKERRWPPENFATCIDSLLHERGGTVFLTGSASEDDVIARVYALSQCKPQIVKASGISFGTYLGLIAQCDGLLGNCSGAVNVAAALGRPAFTVCATSRPAPHSPHLHLIMNQQAMTIKDVNTAQVLRVIQHYFAGTQSVRSAVISR